MTFYTPRYADEEDEDDDDRLYDAGLSSGLNVEALKRLIFTIFRMYNKDPIVSKSQLKNGKSILFAGLDIAVDDVFIHSGMDKDAPNMRYRIQPSGKMNTTALPCDIYERIWAHLKPFFNHEGGEAWRGAEDKYSNVFPSDGKMNPETIQFIIDSIADVYRKLPIRGEDEEDGEDEGGEFDVDDFSTNLMITERVNDSIPGLFQLGKSGLITFSGDNLKVEKINITTEAVCDLATEIAVMQSSYSPNLKRFDALITGKDTIYRIDSGRYVPYSFSRHSTLGHTGELFAAVHHLATMHPSRGGGGDGGEKTLPHAYVHGNLTPHSLYYDRHKRTIALGDFKDVIGFEYVKGKARRVSGPENHRYRETHEFLPAWNPPTFNSGEVFCGGDYVAYLNWDLRGLAFALLSISLGYEASRTDMAVFLERDEEADEESGGETDEMGTLVRTTPKRPSSRLNVLIRALYGHSENSKVWCLPAINHQLALSRQADS